LKECHTVSEVRLSVEPRTEFGKGAARRTRRAGKIPAVLYGHGSDPRHFALPAIEFARVVRENGSNAVITLAIEGSDELALTKTIVVHPLKNYIEHVDLLVVKRGEKIVVDVPVVVTGNPGPGGLVNQDVDTLQVEVEACTSRSSSRSPSRASRSAARSWPARSSCRRAPPSSPTRSRWSSPSTSRSVKRPTTKTPPKRAASRPNPPNKLYA